MQNTHTKCYEDEEHKEYQPSVWANRWITGNDHCLQSKVMDAASQHFSPKFYAQVPLQVKGGALTSQACNARPGEAKAGCPNIPGQPT